MSATKWTPHEPAPRDRKPETPRLPNDESQLRARYFAAAIRCSRDHNICWIGQRNCQLSRRDRGGVMPLFDLFHERSSRIGRIKDPTERLLAFVVEREAIRRRREKGGAKPWTF